MKHETTLDIVYETTDYLISQMKADYNLLEENFRLFKEAIPNRAFPDFSLTFSELYLPVQIHQDKDEDYWILVNGKYFKTHDEAKLHHMTENFQDVVRRLVRIWCLQVFTL